MTTRLYTGSLAVLLAFAAVERRLRDVEARTCTVEEEEKEPPKLTRQQRRYQERQAAKAARRAT